MNLMTGTLADDFEEVLRQFVNTRTDRINGDRMKTFKRLTFESEQAYNSLKNSIPEALLPILVNYANTQSDITLATSYACYQRGFLDGILITFQLIVHE